MHSMEMPWRCSTCYQRCTLVKNESFFLFLQNTRTSHPSIMFKRALTIAGNEDASLRSQFQPRFCFSFCGTLLTFMIKSLHPNWMKGGTSPVSRPRTTNLANSLVVIYASMLAMHLPDFLRVPIRHAANSWAYDARTESWSKSPLQLVLPLKSTEIACGTSFYP